ncbi:thioredoxin domain-containing protein [Streptomyces sp. NPDC051561]|uniref:DsbA family protein n=1 Tax=Streptomyces sp. NPDC051561 TaxID=3365658 RepID=UPI00378ADD2D
MTVAKCPRFTRLRRSVRATVAVLAAGLIAVAAAACASPPRAAAEVSAEDTGQAPRPAGHAKDLPAALAEDGTTIVVGKQDAPHTVRIAVDAQCGYCAKFETGGGQAVAKAVAAGKLKAEYTLASFLDRGEVAGSTRAANALRAALEQGKFAEYQEAVFTAQGSEEAEGFTNAFLLRLASQVEGLRGDAFDRAVGELSYRDWVDASLKAFQSSGEKSVPAVFLDGTKVADGDVLFDAADFAELLKNEGVA